MSRFNGKQDLSKIQLMGRAKGRRRRKHWLEQLPGTKPVLYQASGERVFKPIKGTGPSSFDFGAGLAALVTLLTFRRTRRRQ